MQRMQKLFFFIFDKYNGDVLFPRLLSQKDIKYNTFKKFILIPFK